MEITIVTPIVVNVDSQGYAGLLRLRICFSLLPWFLAY
jgi:hypothetical protein